MDVAAIGREFFRGIKSSKRLRELSLALIDLAKTELRACNVRIALERFAKILLGLRLVVLARIEPAKFVVIPREIRLDGGVFQEFRASFVVLAHSQVSKPEIEMQKRK